MRSRTRQNRHRHRRSGFTLAELLAALLFLAIVIPAAVQALRVASLSGTVAARKGAAARVADRVLNESLVLTNWYNASQRGVVREGNVDYRWSLSRSNWTVPDLQVLTAEVTFSAQGRDFSVSLSTLADVADMNPGGTSSYRVASGN